MKVHSVIDIITNSSTEIFVSAYCTKAMEKLLKKLGSNAKVVIEDDPAWVRTTTCVYEWKKKNGKTELTLEEYLRKDQEDTYKNNWSKTAYLVLESGEKIDLKDVFEGTFNIDAEYNG
jgi:hypothetical protein